MNNLEQAARYEGFFWAESMLSHLQAQASPIPVAWPGTVEQARDLLDAFAEDVHDPMDREWLAGIVMQSARSLWREVTRPDLADAGAGALRIAGRGRAASRALRHVRYRAA